MDAYFSQKMYPPADEAFYWGWGSDARLRQFKFDPFDARKCYVWLSFHDVSCWKEQAQRKCNFAIDDHNHRCHIFRDKIESMYGAEE